MIVRFLLLPLTLLIIATGPTYAVNPSERLDDPVMEAQAREISKNLRCMVCQNQSIDDSDAGLAKDLRILVRQRLVAGDTSKQVLEYVTNRYGDYVLLRPRMSLGTALLWASPALIFLLGLGFAVNMMRRAVPIARHAPDKIELSDAQTRLLEELRDK